MFEEGDPLGYTSDEALEDFYDAAYWWGEALNPIGFITNPRHVFTKRGMVQKGAALTVGGFASMGVYGLTGGGATHHLAREIARPTIFRSAALSVDKYRAMGQTAGSLASTVARGAVRSIPAVSAVGAMAAGVHMFWNQVRSLDWIPNYYIGP